MSQELRDAYTKAAPDANNLSKMYEKDKKRMLEFDIVNSNAFAVEISLAVARKDTSSIQIKNKQDLYRALRNREMSDIVLEQGLEYVLYDRDI